MTHAIQGRNINDVYDSLTTLFKREIVSTHQFKSGTINRESRVGKVHELRGVTVLEYLKPEERVLFCPIRDCNPFFHLMESMWMLAGRGDVEFLGRYSKQAAGLIEGGSSYGYRWREYFKNDQLSALVAKLKNDPGTRRAYLGMWDPSEDLTSTLKDVPCNTGIKFEIRDGSLEMTVFNRSNDAIWGACGANAVHMSFLQEYVAQMVDVPMGSYFQVSGNMHVYEDTYKSKMCGVRPPNRKFYELNNFNHYPMVMNPETFDTELVKVLEGELTIPCDNLFLWQVVARAMKSWDAFKAGNFAEAEQFALAVESMDWSIAMVEWINRHAKRIAK